MRVALLGRDLERVVPGAPVVALVLGDAGELRHGPVQLGARDRRVGEAARSFESRNVEERVRQQVVTIARVAAARDVAQLPEAVRRLVDACPGGLKLPAAAGDVARLELRLPGELPLDPERELPDVRDAVSDARVAGSASEEGLEPLARAGRLGDSLGERVRQVVERRAASVGRRDVGRRDAEAGLEARSGRVHVVLPEAAAQHGFFAQAVGEAGAGLDVVLVPIPRRARVPVDPDEADPALDGEPGQPGRDRVHDVRVEAAVLAVEALADRAVEVPAQPEVERELAGQLPVVLDPGCVVRPEVDRERVVVDHGVGRVERAEQHRRDRVARERVPLVPDALRKPARELQAHPAAAAHLARVLGHPDVDAGPDAVRRPDHGQVRLDADGVGRLLGEVASSQPRVVARVDPGEHLDRELIDQAPGKAELRGVVAEPRVRARQLDVAVAADAHVQEHLRAEGVDPVDDARVIDALQRKLAVGRRA